ncbi:FkbM family methyltransferase [Piscinibacter sakaiensis]|nr:FkbM family methyltransferase [Piscinibacter sakaiensis]
MSHGVFGGIELREESLRRLSFFLKIEEIQLISLVSLSRALNAEWFLDIGANVGFYSLVMGKYSRHVRGLAFEPTPETYKQLRDNLSSSSLASRFSAINAAVSGARGSLQFYDFGDCSGRNGVVSTSIHRRDGVKSVIDVPAVTLDEVCSHLVDRRCVLKIDTEGHEAEVIRGGRKFLRDNTCIVQIEAGHGNGGGAIDSELSGLMYSPLFEIGPDRYYSNCQDYFQSEVRLDLLERALKDTLKFRWNQDMEVW